MIEVCELTKDYGDKRAVNRLSFTARPGVVTGFLGPNGAGKSTTMRIILGVDAPTSGTALVNGEMTLIADQLLIIGRGRLIAETSMRELPEQFQRDVFVRSPRRSGLTRVLTGMGATVLAEPGGGLSVTGMESWRIASAAAAHQIPIQELTPRSALLEDACWN